MTPQATKRSETEDPVMLVMPADHLILHVEMARRIESHGAVLADTIPVEIIEVQTGSYLEEDDIVRYEDRYDRHKDD